MPWRQSKISSNESREIKDENSLKNAPYEEAVATINDVYDFNFEYGGGLQANAAPGFLNKRNRDVYKEMFMDINPIDFIKNGGGVKTFMQIAERYGGFNLPDKNGVMT